VIGCCEHGNEPSELHKMLGNSSVTEQLVVSRERLNFTELETGEN
jgi:hypothetical protein